MKIVPMLILLFVPLSSEAVCTLVTTNLAFGTYATARVMPLDTSGNVTVRCDGVAGQFINYTITLNSGNSGSFMPRKLTNGSFSINYNIYLDAARVNVWGDGNVGTGILSDSYVPIAGVNVRNYTVYGRIPGFQAVAVGNYNDSLVATLTY